MKKALIFGISGQDGSFLAEHLLSLGYEVHGTIRRQSVSRNQESRVSHLEDKIKTYYADLLDKSSLEKVMRNVMPDEIYNLAAQSHVRVSFDIPEFTFQTNAAGVLNLLELYKNICPEAKFYQASSSEMFGNSVDDDGFQRESTPMHPVSPYGIAKLAAYNFVRHYRNAYGLHACNGILFNHESWRRGEIFVTTKIVDAAIRISKGLQDKLFLGNLESQRDWGFSGDYVKAMQLIINQPKPDDFVISTGETHSVSRLCEIAFAYVGLDWQKYVEVDFKFVRPEELRYLKGDSRKARRELNWHPEYTFTKLIETMVENRKKIIL